MIFLNSSEMVPNLQSTISESDIVLCWDDFDQKLLPKNINVEVIKRLSLGQQQQVTSGLTDYIRHRCNANKYLECFINDYYSYSLKPVLSAVVTIEALIKLYNIKSILVITASTNSDLIPLVGFQTTESKRGSTQLLKARLAKQLPKTFPNVEISYQYTKADILCNENIRLLLLGTAGLFLSVFFIFRLIMLRFLNKDTEEKNIVLIRTVHQARFARRLLSESNQFSLLIFPQLSQGGISNIRASLPNNVDFISPKINEIIMGVFRTVKDIAKLSKHRCKETYYLNIDGMDIPIEIDSLRKEIIVVSVAILYKNILSQTLARNKLYKKLVNFELVGRMAGLEALAAAEQYKVIETVQTALISSSPLPIFPHSTNFYTDSYQTVKSIQNIGALVKGTVKYEGPPYPVLELETKEGGLSSIGFFTQPYEIEYTLKILTALCDWAIFNQKKVILKLHPRDDKKLYATLLEKYKGFLFVDEGNTAPNVISQCDLTITRTSSVAKESLALGKPILLCLWSELDRSIRADYIVDSDNGKNFVYNESDLIDVLDHKLEMIFKISRQSQENIFKSKRIDNLVAQLQK